MANIIMMCGIPGSGKSTYVEKHRGEHDLYISRDLIRFSMLEEGQEYFGKEKLVFDTFVKTINQALKVNSIENIWVDATHINPPSRYKILRRISKQYKSLKIIVMDIPLSVCIDRNNYREGRARVPESAINGMYKNFRMPTFEEGYNEIIIVDMYGNETRRSRNV